jgi:thiamine-monophosphate kinase
MAHHRIPSERQILKTIRSLAARKSRSPGHPAVRIGIGDDCAVLTPRPREELVITTDFSIEDRHFRRAWHPPEAIGHKCLARGLSDIAAMGARPLAAFVSLALPRDLAVANKSATKTPNAQSWVARFYHGLLALAERENVALAGGDLSESPTLAFADIVVIGTVPKGRALLRSTARAGDILYVTGSLGAAAAELQRLEKWHASGKQKAYLGHHASEAHPHFYPQPRLATGRALRRRATSCIDISDGLSTDLLHLCEESHLSAELDAASIPVDASATLEQALHGGDDYELLFTAPPKTKMPRQLAGIAIHAIGRMLPKKRTPHLTFIDTSNGKPKRTTLTPRGWQHF